MSKFLFILASIILAWGAAKGVADYKTFADVGPYGMNGFYLLSMALYAASMAAELIWGRRALVQPTVA